MNFRVDDSESTGIARPAALPFFQGLNRIFRVSGLKPIQGRKGIVLLILSLLPIVLMIAARMVIQDTKGRGSEFFIYLAVHYYLNTNMIVYIFLGCSALGNSIEEKTITYDLICPLSRTALYGGRFISYIASALVIILPAQGLSYLVCFSIMGSDTILIPENVRLLFSITLVTAVAAVLYGTAYVFLSLIIKRAVLVAIILSVCIDGFVANIPHRICTLSLQYHFRNLMCALGKDKRFFGALEAAGIDVGVGYSILTLTLLWVLFTVGGVMVFARREFR